MQHNIIQAHNATKICGKRIGLACELSWQRWKTGGDYYHKYSLLQILHAFSAYICTVVIFRSSSSEMGFHKDNLLSYINCAHAVKNKN